MTQLTRQKILAAIENYKQCIKESEEMLTKLPKAVLLDAPDHLYGLYVVVGSFENEQDQGDYQAAFQTLLDLLKCEGSVKSKEYSGSKFGYRISLERNVEVILTPTRYELIVFSSREYALEALSSVGEDRVEQMIDVFFGCTL